MGPRYGRDRRPIEIIQAFGIGLANFSAKGQLVNILGFAGHMVSVAMLSCAAVVQKQPWAIRKQPSVSVFQ